MSVKFALEQFFKLTWPNRRDTSGSLTFFEFCGAIKAVPGLRPNIFAKKWVCICKERDRHTKKTMKHQIARTVMCCVMPVLSKSSQMRRPSVTNQQVNQLTSQPGNQLTSKTVNQLTSKPANLQTS